MDGLRGKTPQMVPAAEAFKNPNHRFFKKTEKLLFLKPSKEPTYVLPKPVIPIFKSIPEEAEEGTLSVDQQEPGHRHSPSTVDEESGEDFEDYEDERESEMFSEDEGVFEKPESEEVEGTYSEIETQVFPTLESPRSLVMLCLKVLADNFSTIWKYFQYISVENQKILSEMIDLDSTDVGQAARAIDIDPFWERWTNHRWRGYHKPWAHRGCWKVYFLEKYLAEFLTAQDPDRYKLRDLCRLARRINNWIYMLNIKQLSCPPWPAAVDVENSTDTEGDSDDEISIYSTTSLDNYLNKHINYFPMPLVTTRLPLQPVFRILHNLTHLILSFGTDNMSRYKDFKLSKITDEDAVNLSQAIASCCALYCFKLTRSRMTPSQLELIIYGLSEVESLREVDFSHMFINDNHMVSISGLLAVKLNLKVLCLRNNNIGSEGLIRLLHVIVLKDCQLKILDVSMNPIGDAGGVAMTSLLAKKNRYIKKVFMSGTNLTYISGYNFGIVLYFNKNLELLDLSVNEFSDFAAEALLKGLEHNYTLKRIDIRGCGIPFPTVREMERICFRNTEIAFREKYKYPAVHPKDFWSGFHELDAPLPEDLLKPPKTDEELAREEEEVMAELQQIFTWATAQMKPRNRLLIVRDIHALMKKSLFVTGFNSVIDKLILTKQKELIRKSRIDSIREKEERQDGSSMMIDFSNQEFMKKTCEKLKSDYLELEALQVMKDVNRCGRIDELFKTVKSDAIDTMLKNIGKALDADMEMPSTAGINLPFARKRYRGFPDPEPEEKISEGDEEIEYENENGSEEDEMVDAEEKASKISCNVEVGRISTVKDQFSMGQISKEKKKSSVVLTSRSLRNSLIDKRNKSNVDELIQSENDSAFQAARDEALNIRAKYKKWPKEGPPTFPRVIPYEMFDNCQDELPDTESENEDDFPYWLDQWLQKY